MELRRVVVTGIGAITPLGNDAESTWKNLVDGVSGCATITRFDASKFKTQFACEVKDFNALDHFDRKEARKIDPYTQFALIAAKQAVADSKITDKEDLNQDRVGVIWGSGIGGLKTFHQSCA